MKLILKWCLAFYEGVSDWLDLKMIEQFLSYLLMGHLIWWHTGSVHRFIFCRYEISFCFESWHTHKTHSQRERERESEHFEVSVDCTISFQVKPLIWVEANVEKHSKSRIEIMVKARSQFKERRYWNFFSHICYFSSPFFSWQKIRDCFPFYSCSEVFAPEFRLP
jgi:hypothetical protein